MKAEIEKLEALFEKDLAQWTPEERDRYKNYDGLREELREEEERLYNVQSRSLALEQRLTMLLKIQFQYKLDKLTKISTVVTLEDFMALDLPFKEKPGNENIADHVFAKTVDRDYIFKDVLRAFVQIEPLRSFSGSLREVGDCSIFLRQPLITLDSHTEQQAAGHYGCSWYNTYS